jgi:YbbR domain-containing protein
MSLLKDLRYKLLALAIAALLWVVASGTSSVERGFDVPITFQGVPDDVVIVDKSTDQVNLRVMGSRAALRNVSPGAMEYRLEVSGAKQGVAHYEIDVSQLDLPRGARIVSRSPSSLEVKFERRGTKVVRVRPDLEGEPPQGFEVGAVVVEPERVRITGARSEVLRLSEVITEAINLSGQREALERDVRLSVGGRNAWVEEPTTVKVRVAIAPVAPPEPTPQPPGAEEEKKDGSQG